MQIKRILGVHGDHNLGPKELGLEITPRFRAAPENVWTFNTSLFAAGHLGERQGRPLNSKESYRIWIK